MNKFFNLIKYSIQIHKLSLSSILNPTLRTAQNNHFVLLNLKIFNFLSQFLLNQTENCKHTTPKIPHKNLKILTQNPNPKKAATINSNELIRAIDNKILSNWSRVLTGSDRKEKIRKPASQRFRRSACNKSAELLCFLFHWSKRRTILFLGFGFPAFRLLTLGSPFHIRSDIQVAVRIF